MHAAYKGKFSYLTLRTKLPEKLRIRTQGGLTPRNKRRREVDFWRQLSHGILRKIQIIQDFRMLLWGVFKKYLFQFLFDVPLMCKSATDEEYLPKYSTSFILRTHGVHIWCKLPSYKAPHLVFVFLCFCVCISHILICPTYAFIVFRRVLRPNYKWRFFFI